MSIAQKQTATQSQKLMIFVLSMSLYGLATLFTELDPQVPGGGRGVLRGVLPVHPPDPGHAV